MKRKIFIIQMWNLKSLLWRQPCRHWSWKKEMKSTHMGILSYCFDKLFLCGGWEGIKTLVSISKTLVLCCNLSYPLIIMTQQNSEDACRLIWHIRSMCLFKTKSIFKEFSDVYLITCIFLCKTLNAGMAPLLSRGSWHE